MKRSHIRLEAIADAAIYKTQELELWHKDPFDRLIIATSLIKQIPLISGDQKFKRYPSQVLW